MSKASKSIRNIMIVSSAVLAGMHVYNRFISKAAVKGNRLPDNQGEFFEWTHGKIYYQKKGNGAPILLIHDVDPAASSMEWCKISHKLAKSHTVYTIDLLGCGRSDKPAIEYSNYLYVQMITAFIQEVIGLKTDVIASNLATSFVLAANNLDSDLFDHIVCINPVPFNELELTPTVESKTKKFLLNTPIIGTFMYNVLSNPLHIDQIFKNQYYSKGNLASLDLKETYYESAHLKESRGKYLLSSIFGNFMHVNLKHALKKIDKPICLIGSRELPNNRANLEQYAKESKYFDITMLSGAKNYPQLEIPEKTLKVIYEFLYDGFLD